VDVFSKYRLSLVAIGILIVLNVGSLGMIWYGHFTRPAPPPRPEGRERAEAVLAHELRLTDEQTRRFHELRARHFVEVEKIRLEIYDLARAMVKELFRPSPDTEKVTALSAQIGRKQAEFERLVFFHFRDLKELCRPDQRERLQSVLYEMLEASKLKPPPPPLPHGERPR
jgi:protein CpxP